jgi:hypothetical protein
VRKLILLFTGLVLLTPVSLGQSRGGDTTSTRVVYYDVTVMGEFNLQGQHFVPEDPNNMFNLHGGWIQVGTEKRSVARWQNVGIRIYSAYEPGKPSGASLILPALGTIQVSGSPELGNPPDRCTWDGATVTYNNVELDIGFALKPNQSNNGIWFSVNRPKYSDAQKNSGCADWSSPYPWGSDWGWSGPNVTLPNKIKFAPSSPLSFWSAADAGIVPFPLDEILAWRSFVIETGTQSFANEKTGARQQFSQRIEFEARKHGKCDPHNGRIQEGPDVQDEDVHINADASEITPEGNTKVHIKVRCDVLPVEGAKVEIKVEPVDSSGGHIHVKDRPKGKLDGKDLTGATPSITRTTDKYGNVNGSAGITFAPPGKEPISRCIGLAGDYKVTAALTSERFKGRKDSTMILVRFKDLTMLPKGQNYDICADSKHGCDKDGPWGTPEHPDSEYGTAGTIKAFQSLATDFWNSQLTHNQLLHDCGKPPWPMVKASFNDIALPWGGLFDMNSTWKQPHQTHGKGQGGDFNHLKPLLLPLDCSGHVVDSDTYMWYVLKNTAQPKYGKWDGEVAKGGELHLHVEDQGQGLPDSPCPADN